MKPILEIHEWRKEFESLPLEDYILTFDDGLYSQFRARHFLKELNTEKIFFISSDIIRPKYQDPSKDVISCFEAHKKAFNNPPNKEDYMSWGEVKQMAGMFEVGGHSHYHRMYSKVSLKDFYANLIADTERMFRNFKDNGIEITKFCFPYNETYDGIYRVFLAREGIEDFYGGDRIPIEKLLNEMEFGKTG
jgi:hypothetical protein